METNVQFGVHVFENERWILNGFFDDEGSAVTRARQLLESGRYQAVKAVRESVKQSGFSSSKIVFAAEKEKAKAKIAARRGAGGDIVCTTVEDLFGDESAAAIGSVLADYLGWRGITPTELLHHYAHAAHLSQYGMLEHQAISIVAAVQAERSGVPHEERRALLEKLWHRAVQRARKARDGGNIPDLAEQPLAEAWRQLDERVDARTRDYLLRSGASSLLAGIRSGRDRTEALVALLGDDSSESESRSIAAVIDPFVADMLRAAVADEDILGPRNGLAETLSALGQLLRGDPASADLAPPGRRLAQFIADGSLPLARRAAIGRLVGAVNSETPLGHGGPAEEIAALYRVAAMLRLEGGAFPDDALDEAVAARSARQVRAEADRLLRASAAATARIAAILDLKDFIFGAASRAVAMEALSGAIDLARAAGDLAAPGADPVERMRALAGLQRQVDDFGADTEAAAPCADRLDHEAARVLEESRLLDRLTAASPDGLAAIGQLADLFRRQAVTRGQATDVVRRHAMELLRRPGVLESLSPAAGEEAAVKRRLRTLWRDLRDVGLI